MNPESQRPRPFFLTESYQEKARAYWQSVGEYRKIGPHQQKQPLRCVEDDRGIRPEEGACRIHGTGAGAYLILPEDAERYGEWLMEKHTEPDWPSEMSAYLWLGFLGDDSGVSP